MITPEPPAGSEHYREGWRHGYEQAAIDRERSADAARLVPTATLNSELKVGAVPDIGQAREPGYERIAQAIEDVCDAAEMDVDAYRNSVGIEKPYLALARALDKAGLIDWAAFDEPSGDTVQAPDTDGPSDALVLTAAAGRLRAMSEHHRQEFSHTLSGIARWMEMVLYVEDNADEQARALRSARALLGTDTTPDRLAWISEAGETAAAERQARYQETACALRPAATSGDPAQPDLAYARSEVGKWLDDGDPYCILPTRTEHIPALLARLDELEGTR